MCRLVLKASIGLSRLIYFNDEMLVIYMYTSGNFELIFVYTMVENLEIRCIYNGRQFRNMLVPIAVVLKW